MFKRTKVCTSVLLALSGFAAISTSAQAQQQLERVEITGSSIKRFVDTDSALPISVISADELRSSGVNTAEGALSRIASNQSMTGSSQSIGSGTAGAAYANMRGLGANKTLVLLNGRRVAAFAFSSSAVDLNSIPFAAIDRIEVLRDGASAIYGTDAIGGVINFITKKNYHGASLDVNYSQPQHEGGKKKGAALSGGFGDLEKDGFNIWAAGDIQKNDKIRAVWRDFGATGVIPDKGVELTSGTTFPGNFSQGSLSGNPSKPTCAPPYSLYLPNTSTKTCRFDYTAMIDLVPETENKTVNAKGTVKLGDAYVSLEHMYTDSRNLTHVAPDPMTGLTMTPSSPFYPKTYPGIDPTKNISVGWRMMPAGPRTGQSSTQAERTVLSVDGSFGSWDYRGGIYSAESRGKQAITDGYLNKAIIKKGVLDGKLNPFGDNDAAGMALIDSAKINADYSAAKGTTQGVDFNMSTTFGSMAGGPIGVSIGAESRKEKYTNNTVDDIVNNVPSLGASPYHVEGSRTVQALSAELLFPVLKTLELSLAARYDKYSDFGSTVNPKVSFRWAPIKTVSVRGSYNTGFRAPSLDEVFGPQSVSFTSDAYDDPLLCPGGVVTGAGIEPRDCGQQGQIKSGGNPALKPETSKTFSLGLAFEPMKDLTASIDYWNVKMAESISTIGEATIMGNPTKYAGRYFRCKDLPGDVQDTLDRCQGEWKNGNGLGYIVSLNDNLGGVRTDGFDFALGYGVNSSFGKWQFNWEATYVRSYEFQRDKGEDYIQNVGKYVDSSPVLRWQHNFGLNWKMGNFSALYNLNYKSGYIDQNQVDDQYFNTVKAYTVSDLALTYTGLKYSKFTVGVQNLFDTKPPFSNQGTTFQKGYDPRLASAYGRTFQFRAGFAF